MNLDRSFYRFVTIHVCDGWTDGRTDRQTEFSLLDRVCIPCSAVKTKLRDVTSHIFAQTTHIALPPPNLSCGVGSRT